MQALMGDQVRLNYVIADELEISLLNYCKVTGRTASDVVRQLVCEFLEGDRLLPAPARDVWTLARRKEKTRRTDMWVSPKTLAALDEQINVDRLGTRSDVIRRLLSCFLQDRSNHTAEESVRLTVFVSRDTYTRLREDGAPFNRTPEETISKLSNDYAQSLRERTN